MPNEKYIFNSELRIFETSSAPINYTDGAEIESYILQSVSGASDLSVDSEELAAKIRDWPSEYHLSSLRGNLLRGFDFPPGSRALELGSGCGVITRQLGEKGLTVTAVEGSRERAHITRMRCRDQQNVTVYRDTIAEFESDERFDFILLIGVLEYSPAFIEGADPIGALLRRVRALLAPGGTLIIAIENQLGLKYLNGHLEDHIGRPFWGIENLYEKKGPVTFGRKELERRLSKAGFDTTEFFYPWPDYKIPTVVVSPAGAQSETLQIPDLLLRVSSRSYNANPLLSFDEGLAQDAVWSNQLGGDLSNSFLAVASSGSVKKADSLAPWLAKYYSVMNSRVRSETTFETDSTGRIDVKKVQFTRTVPAEVTGSQLRWRHDDPEYVVGRNYHREFLAILARGGTFEELAAYLKPWAAYLTDKSSAGPDGQRMLPGDLIDCVPFNLIIEDTGKFRVIDLEWVSDSPVPIMWVLARGILFSLQLAKTRPAIEGRTYRECIARILEILGFGFDDDSVRLCSDMETGLLHFVSGEAPAPDRRFDRLLSATVSRGEERWPQKIAEQAKQIIETRNQLDQNTAHTASIEKQLGLERRRAGLLEQRLTEERQSSRLLETRIAEHEARIAEHEGRIAELLHEKQSAESSASALQKTLESVTTSKSWQVTAPLRAAAAILKR